MPTRLNTRKTANRLIEEKSPYLLQHAHNPVDWYPWGEEAFERARREDKPVFLSIGYSTCHWCHVMEKESFEDEETALALNEAFVCVKVDREERPDLDQVYMAVCMALTGTGGWPLTILMTADKKPFFAGTYFPKARRWGRPGLMEIVPLIKDYWATRRKEVIDASEKIMTEVLGKRSPAAGAREPAPETLEDAAREFEADFDETNAGFGSAPKFPAPHNLSFLLRFWKRTGQERVLSMAERTLGAMRAGGIFDHLGYGFHRYSTDSHWLVPHFEKMLYDQALISKAFAEAYLATGRIGYKETSLETLDYVLRDLASPDGGFYSAEDADSEGEEGRFYLWTEDEIRKTLNKGEAGFALRSFSVRPDGNFAEPERTPDGRNILHMMPGASFEHRARDGERLREIRQKLFLAREIRPRPFKDTKILADWNGMAIAALASAGRIADDPRYLRAAERAARFILGDMRGPRGRLFHVHSGGEARVPGFLDDHAFVINGLIELYESTFDPFYLREAVGLADRALALFMDRDKGGFFFAPPDSEFPVRKKEIYDGATPSGNSMMLMDLLRLARLTGRLNFDEAAAATAAAFSGEASAHPRAHTAFLHAMDFAFGPSYEVVIAGKRGDERTEALLDVMKKNFLPNAVTLFKPEDGGAEELASIAPFTRTMGTLEGRPAAYVCAKGHCLRPVEEPGDLLGLLSRS